MDNKTIDINTENFTVVNGDITEEQIATWKGKHRSEERRVGKECRL